MDPAIRFGDESLVSAPSVIRVKPGMLFDVLVSSVDEAGRPSERTSGPLKAQLSLKRVVRCSVFATNYVNMY